jgi:hypothetical protein
MNTGIRRLSTHTSLVFFGLMLSSTTGCSLLSAAGNPGAMWAINDPAPLTVVVRRADAAQITTVEVNRLLTSTPTGKDTTWTLSVSPDPKIAAADIKALQADPDYAKTKARVVAAEVWIRTLPSVTSPTGEHPNLLAAIDQGLADSYAAIVAKQGEIAGLTTQIETEKAAAGADGVTPADKKTHQDAVAALQKQEDDAEKAVDPLKKTFLGQVKDASAKLAPDDQKRYAPAVGSLLQALADADIANSAAALKYPIVIKTLPDAIKSVIPSIAADVIEEQTGARPNLANLKVKVDITGSSVTVGLDGLGDLGALKPADVITETTKRSVHWFTHTLTLLGTISSTKESLNFERETLNQMAAAFAPSGPAVIVVKIPAFDSPEVTAAVAAPSISLAAKVHAKAAASAPPPAATASVTVDATAGGKKTDPKAAAKTPPSKKKQ